MLYRAYHSQLFADSCIGAIHAFIIIAIVLFAR